MLVLNEEPSLSSGAMTPRNCACVFCVVRGENMNSANTSTRKIPTAIALIWRMGGGIDDC